MQRIDTKYTQFKQIDQVNQTRKSTLLLCSNIKDIFLKEEIIYSVELYTTKGKKIKLGNQC